MEALIRIMQKYSSGKIISALFVFTMVVYIAMLSYSIPAVTKFAPEIPLFDLSPSGYAYNYANELLHTLGADGRNLYLSIQLPLDFIYPGLFSVTYSLMLVWLCKKLLIKNTKIYYLALVPFLAGIFDYVENIYIIKMINSFPDLQVSTVKIASLFTVLKSSFTLIFFILLIVGFVMLLKKKLSKNSQQLG
ncbi:hypothetical protein [Algibacillus agarilyticus]|uniref:hypothetical protein n=1 Tax=Algibacillus agarilyticus TaxID=2234133 RepID=UPI000DD021BB|nr:hypothetical protein [Algibacillus agarilyticus]